MIFVTVGSQRFQFNRLLMAIDELIDKGIITEEVFAQTGYCDYEPIHYSSVQFLDQEEFAMQLDKCDILITHGGTGTIVGGVKKSKTVIAVPRLAKYGEHVDDHQKELISQFSKHNLIIGLNQVNELENIIPKARLQKLSVYKGSNSEIIRSIESFIEYDK